MIASNLSFHHFGLATSIPAEAAAFLTLQGYAIGETVFDPEQMVNLRMCTHQAFPSIEIITPAQGKSPIDSLLARHREGIVYHCCYMTSSLQDTLDAFAGGGIKFRCVSPPKPAILFALKRVSFYQILGIGLIEIIDCGDR